MEFIEALPSYLEMDYKSLEERYVAAFHIPMDYLNKICKWEYKETKLLQSKSKQSRMVRVVINFGEDK